MRTAIEEFTVQKATSLLKRGAPNRHISDYHVALLAGDMQRGTWLGDVNGDTIKINQKGQVVDGQHRLTAFVKAATGGGIATMKFLVCRDVPDEAFYTLDRGKRRSVGDLLSIQGESNCNHLAAVLRALHNINNGLAWSTDCTPAQMLEMLVVYPTAREWTNKVVNTRSSYLFGAGFSAILVVGEVKHGHDLPKSFLDCVGSGVGLPADHPALVLRERLTRARALPSQRLSPATRAAFQVKAWNAFVQGKPVKVLRHNPDDEFPVLI